MCKYVNWYFQCDRCGKKGFTSAKPEHCAKAQKKGGRVEDCPDKKDLEDKTETDICGFCKAEIERSQRAWLNQ